MVFQLLDLEPWVAPVFLEDIFLLAVQALHANRELPKLLREFLSVDNRHSRVWTRPERQSLRARSKDALSPSASS